MAFERHKKTAATGKRTSPCTVDCSGAIERNVTHATVRCTVSVRKIVECLLSATSIKKINL